MKIMTPIAEENVRKIHAAGGVVACGTDQSSGAATQRELELLVAAGFLRSIPYASPLTTARCFSARRINLAQWTKASSPIWCC